MDMIDNNAKMVQEEIVSINYEIDSLQDGVAEISRTSVYFGKTVDQWSNYFQIPISGSADPVMIKDYIEKLNERFDKAYRYKAKVSMMYRDFKNLHEQKKMNLVEKHAMNKSRKTMPAAETLDKVADSQLGIYTVTCHKYENSIAFWQDVIYKLRNNLEMLQIMSMNNGTMAKIERGLT